MPAVEASTAGHAEQAAGEADAALRMWEPSRAAAARARAVDGGRVAPAATQDAPVAPVFQIEGLPLPPVAPAAADPADAAAWLEQVRRLWAAGQADAARASLQRLLQAHPSQQVPDDLRELLAPAP